jgi:hypothetical protein
MDATQWLHRRKTNKNKTEIFSTQHKRIKNRRLTTERRMSILRKCN